MYASSLEVHFPGLFLRGNLIFNVRYASSLSSLAKRIEIRGKDKDSR